MTWELVDNPAYAGRTPTILKASCHDRTPCLDVRCDCGGELHVHESQFKDAPADAEVGARCPMCSQVLVFPPGWFADAFQRLRDEGWIE